MRYFKKCEEFFICGSTNKKKEVFAETSETLTLFYIVVRGGAKIVDPYNSTVINCSSREIVNIKPFLGKDRIALFNKRDGYYESYGFNPLNKSEDWSAKKITSSFMGDTKSWIICFDGEATINGKLVKKFDYAKLEDKHYEVEVGNSLLGVFTKE